MDTVRAGDNKAWTEKHTKNTQTCWRTAGLAEGLDRRDQGQVGALRQKPRGQIRARGSDLWAKGMSPVIFLPGFQ